MGNFWNNLSERERLLLRVAGVLAAVLFLVLLVVRPINGWRSEKEADVNRAANTYEMVAEAAAASGGASSSKAVRDAQTPIAAIISTTAAGANVSLNAYNGRPNGTVEATITATQPPFLFEWMGMLETEYGLQVEYADIAREQTDPALVRAQLTFSRPNGARGE